MTFSDVLTKLKSRNNLNREDLEIIVDSFEKKLLSDEDIEKLVTLWHEKKETSRELVNLADILYTKQNKITSYEDSVDVCGTGGDRSNTFNISTLTAIVASSCGVKIIKHSGRSTTSITGSVDILSQFGFEIDVPCEVKENCFKKNNLMIVSSKILRGIFGDVKRICKKINSPGFVNLLGPLSNPYKTNCHLLGVRNSEWGNLMASCLKLQDKKEALVVCSKVDENVYLDELSFSGENFIWHLKDGNIKEEKLLPADFNKKAVRMNELVITSADEGKAIFEDVLRGNFTDKTKAKVDIIALNAGAAIYLAKFVKSINDGYQLAFEHIKSGKVWEHFQSFLNCNRVGRRDN